MLALRVDKKRVAVRDIAKPLAENEALVRVVLSGICNTDLEIARGTPDSKALSDTSSLAWLKTVRTSRS